MCDFNAKQRSVEQNDGSRRGKAGKTSHRMISRTRASIIQETCFCSFQHFGHYKILPPVVHKKAEFPDLELKCLSSANICLIVKLNLMWLTVFGSGLTDFGSLVIILLILISNEVSSILEVLIVDTDQRNPFNVV